MADAGTLILDPVAATLGEARASASPTEAPGRSGAVLGAAVAIIIAGAAIRVAALSTSIWFDEAVSVSNVSGSFGQMLGNVVNHEASPPFYFICLWVWRHLVGRTAVDLRTLSALAGTMTIALAFWVARRRIGARAALVLAVCVAVSPVLVYYSTEMRMYALLVLITGVGFEAFLRASESPNRANLSVWAGASILALWTQYYAALAVAPEAALLTVLAWPRRPRGRGTLAAVGGVALGALPLIYLMYYQEHHAFAYGRKLLSSVWQRFQLSFHVNSSLSRVTQELVVGPDGLARVLLTLVILLIGVGVGVVLLLRHPQLPNGQLIRGFYLLAPALLAVVTLVCLHITVNGRYLLPLWLPVGLAASWALTSTGRPGLGLAGVLICVWVGIGVATMVVTKFSPRIDTLGAARSLGVPATDRVIALNEPDVVSFQAYRPQTFAETHSPVRVRELDVVVLPSGAKPPTSEDQQPTSRGTGVLPAGLRLAQVIRSSTFLVERFVASTPVSIQVDGRGEAFRARSWRFLAEPAGGRIGGL